MGIAEVEAFIAKWQRAALKERSASQEHFIDLCRLFGEKTPAEADPDGEWYCFEAGAKKLGGGDGWADVWKRGYFAWEYKGKKKDLIVAYRQLNQYREDLENPPLLVVCDTDRFEIHTNFTGTVVKVHKFSLDGLRDPDNRRVLQAVFTSPTKLRPRETPKTVTEEAAAKVAGLAGALEARGVEPQRAAHFLMQIVFCMFAEDIGILPGKLLTKLLGATRHKPESFEILARDLFVAMKDGGYLGLDPIPWFNGGLFVSDDVIALKPDELDMLQLAAKLDWSGVEPAIFGTLFERSLDPDKRGQTGAHYTSPEDIMLIIEPVVFAPLRREWAQVREQAERVLQRGGHAPDKSTRTKAVKAARKEVNGFLERLRLVKVFDPACGSGNFLYLSLRGLKDIEGEVIAFSSRHGLGDHLPFVSPAQLYGMEVNPYAHELAQVVVWIGHLQWAYQNAFAILDEPVLKKIDNIQNRDSILSDDLSSPRPQWPPAEFIVGNPPFLGGKLLRTRLGDSYVDALFAAYEGRVPREADLVCYWFERARNQLIARKAKRVGFVATNSIRFGKNRVELDHVKKAGDIFMAWSDRPWVLDGAAVRVSMIGFDDGTEAIKVLDGAIVQRINPDLTSTVDVTVAVSLSENAHVAFMGDTKGGKFDISSEKAAQLLRASNPDGRSNADVVRPWVNGLDVLRRPRNKWIIDFGTSMDQREAALYEQPFEYVHTHVYPTRKSNKREQYAKLWWIHAEPRSMMRKALKGLPRYLATPRNGRHRLFLFFDAAVLPDCQLIVVARHDWFTFGLLQSRAHQLWSLRKGSKLGAGNDPRYTPTTTFETFPFPRPVREEVSAEIARAAEELYRLRESALKENSKRTLTSLYRTPPSWLRQRHEALDRAVLAAYGWPGSLSDEEVLIQLLALNQSRAQAQTPIGQQLGLGTMQPVAAEKGATYKKGQKRKR